MSNRGTAFTWLYVSEVGRSWLFWLLAGLIIAIVVGIVRRRQLTQQGRVGSTLPWAAPAFLLVAVVGYFVTGATAALPDNVAYELRRGDRGTLLWTQTPTPTSPMAWIGCWPTYR
ncbi:MAG: hypothetical protein R2873_06905 [Caldilineaceae bacterium]